MYQNAAVMVRKRNHLDFTILKPVRDIMRAAEGENNLVTRIFHEYPSIRHVAVQKQAPRDASLCSGKRQRIVRA